jgi:hypothetical protein
MWGTKRPSLGTGVRLQCAACAACRRPANRQVHTRRTEAHACSPLIDDRRQAAVRPSAECRESLASAVGRVEQARSRIKSWACIRGISLKQGATQQTAPFRNIVPASTNDLKP